LQPTLITSFEAYTHHLFWQVGLVGAVKPAKQISMSDLLKLFDTLKRSFAFEYAAHKLSALAPALVTPLLRRQVKAWSPLERKEVDERREVDEPGGQQAGAKADGSTVIFQQLQQWRELLLVHMDAAGSNGSTNGNEGHFAAAGLVAAATAAAEAEAMFAHLLDVVVMPKVGLKNYPLE
jgi:hypothetical protein